MEYITTKEKAFADKYLEKGSVSEAYQSINPLSTVETARVGGSKYLSKPEVKEYILQELQVKERTSPARIVEKWGEMLEANKAIVVDKGIEYVADNPTQLEALKNITEIYGGIGGGDMLVDARSVNINITTQEAENLSIAVSKLEELSKRLMGEDEQSGEVIDVSPADSSKS